MCLNPSHSHHRQAHTYSCHLNQQLSSRSSTKSVQPTTHINAALANAYAVGWAAGAAALVQQQQRDTITSVIPSSVEAPVVMCPPVSSVLLHTHTSGPPRHYASLTSNSTLEVLPVVSSLPTSTSCTTTLSNSTIMALNAYLNFQTTSVTASINPVTGMTSVLSVLTQSTLGTNGTGPSSSTTNSVGSISGSSSTDSGSSASPMFAGSSTDLTDDFSAGLLCLKVHLLSFIQGTVQELMPDLKADKDELIRRFEAMMCPFSALHVARTAINQHDDINRDSSTAIAMSTNAAVLALSKLIDQQSQCCVQSSYPGNSYDVIRKHLIPKCIHHISSRYRLF
ncbi:Ankyrin repeat domain-containing protein 17 [Schistosoma japonicum]|uniref:Ankyrin repeat domain-containing protein 17 n=1 Tax=Schistosoma japonicum TaxID=6182 RepID=A0A4Z2CLA3_SCHJA|nr:Ankyrin repeat domain-containing protein 17 [Schistosoma japonicum]